MKINAIFFPLLIFIGCAEMQEVENAPPSPFMDIKDYFEKEMKKERLNARKITRIGEDSEQVIIDKLNIEEELRIFADADISKVAWYEKYDITTKGALSTYTANDDKLKTRVIKIYKSSTQVDSLFIHNKMKSMIMDTDQYLSYFPDMGYKIRIEQIGKLQNGNSYIVNVKY